MSPPTSPVQATLYYFGLAFAVSWIAGLMVAAVMQALLPESMERATLLLAKYGPTIAALVMALVVSGRAGVAFLLRNSLRLRAHPLWYVVVLLGPPFLWWAALVLFQATGGEVDWAAPRSTTPTAALVALATFTFLGGGFGEEPGWRGFALPMLQRRLNALASTLLIGFVWAVWHFPAYLFDDGGMSPPWLFTLFVLSAAVILTCIVNSSGGNVLLAVLFHASFNASENLMEPAVATVDQRSLEIYLTGLYVVIAVGLVVALRPVHLSWRSRTVWPAEVDGTEPSPQV